MHCQDHAFSSSLLASAASHKPGMLKWPNSESQNENWNGQKIDNVSQGKIVMLIYSDPLCKWQKRNFVGTENLLGFMPNKPVGIYQWIALNHQTNILCRKLIKA